MELLELKRYEKDFSNEDYEITKRIISTINKEVNNSKVISVILVDEYGDNTRVRNGIQIFSNRLISIDSFSDNRRYSHKKKICINILMIDKENLRKLLIVLMNYYNFLELDISSLSKRYDFIMSENVIKDLITKSLILNSEQRKSYENILIKCGFRYERTNNNKEYFKDNKEYELIYKWKKNGFVPGVNCIHFTHEYEIRISDDNVLDIRYNDNSIKDFYQTNIITDNPKISFSAIVGENGSGKTTIVKDIYIRSNGYYDKRDIDIRNVSPKRAEYALEVYLNRTSEILEVITHGIKIKNITGEPNVRLRFLRVPYGCIYYNPVLSWNDYHEDYPYLSTGSLLKKNNVDNYFKNEFDKQFDFLNDNYDYINRNKENISIRLPQKITAKINDLKYQKSDDQKSDEGIEYLFDTIQTCILNEKDDFRKVLLLISIDMLILISEKKPELLKKDFKDLIEDSKRYQEIVKQAKKIIRNFEKKLNIGIFKINTSKIQIDDFLKNCKKLKDEPLEYFKLTEEIFRNSVDNSFDGILQYLQKSDAIETTYIKNLIEQIELGLSAVSIDFNLVSHFQNFLEKNKQTLNEEYELFSLIQKEEINSKNIEECKDDFFNIPIYIDHVYDNFNDIISNSDEDYYAKTRKYYISTDCGYVLKNKLNKFIKCYSIFSKKYERQIFQLYWEMSTGEVALLSLYANLFWRKKYNMKKNRNMPNEIIYIDEADYLLHPSWQQNYIKSLYYMLPNIFKECSRIQVVLATHSPIILSDIPKQNVIFLSPSNKTITNIKIKETFAANIFDLYNNAFFLNEGMIGSFATEYLIKLIDDIKTLEVVKDENKIHEIEKRINTIGDRFMKSKIIELFMNKKKSISYQKTIKDDIEQIKDRMEKDELFRERIQELMKHEMDNGDK